jgi:hypothetical protein
VDSVVSGRKENRSALEVVDTSSGRDTGLQRPETPELEGTDDGGWATLKSNWL